MVVDNSLLQTLIVNFLEQVQEQLTLSESTNSQTNARASVILIITDGRLNDVQQSVSKVSDLLFVGMSGAILKSGGLTRHIHFLLYKSYDKKCCTNAPTHFPSLF